MSADQLRIMANIFWILLSISIKEMFQLLFDNLNGLGVRSILKSIDEKTKYFDAVND